MQRGVLYAAKIHQTALEQSRSRFRGALVTTTYAPGVEWSPNHIKALLKHYRQWCRRRGVLFRYVWTIELTRAGVPHYHIVLWLPRGLTPPLPDKQGWWPHGMSNAKWARSPVGYIAKYASKGGKGEIPFGAHLWGAGGLDLDGRRQLRWHLCPSWLKQFSTVDDDVRRLPPPPATPWLVGWWRVGAVALRSPWEFDGARMLIRWRGFTSDDVSTVAEGWS